QPDRGRALPYRDPLVGSHPLEIQPNPTQSATQVAAASANVSPQGGLQCGRKRVARAQPVRSAHVLVVDEELIEIRHGTHPSDAKEAGRWPRSDAPHEPSEVSPICQGHPATLGELLEGSRQDEARTCDDISLAHHEMRREITRSPASEQRGNARTKVFEQAAQGPALQRVKLNLTHEPSEPAV